MIVAIDGPAGCGKSSIAKMISSKLGFTYINSGNVYRAISLFAIERGVGVDDNEGLIESANLARIDYDVGGTFRLNGRKVDTELRGAEVDAIVAQVSAVPEIRGVVNAIVRQIARGRDAVVEGRDMTTVVFPDAEVKFYLDASVEVRARRRFDQHTSKMSLEEITQNIRMRDAIDTSKAVGALKIAQDAQYLDTSCLTIEQVYEKVYSKILHVRETHGQ